MTAMSSANLGFEPKLWLAADKFRGTIDSGEDKHVILGLRFLKNISDAFEELHSQLKEGKGEFKGSDAEDADEYSALNVLWVAKSARWDSLQAKAKQLDIGKLIDDTMVAIEIDNPRLKDVLPKEYARPLQASTLLKYNPDIVKCLFVVYRTPAVPNHLIFSTQVPVCLWFLGKNKAECNSSRAGLSGDNEMSPAA